MNKKLSAVLEIFLILLFFIASTYLIQNFNLEMYLDIGFLGMLIYVLLAFVAVVIAPISTIPLIPLASNMWGWKIAGGLSIIGWTLGSLVAFILARRYGEPIIRKIISLDRLHSIESKLPRENLFLGVLFLRMAVPVDVLSYAIGLFSKMELKSYFWATLIGVSPFAFILAYAGMVSPYYQLIIITVAIIIFLGGYLIYKKEKKEK